MKKMANGRIIGVISIKGGVGKTTTVSNLGTVLANQFGKKVLLVDANFTAPNLGLHLGVVKPKVTLHDVLAGKVNAVDAIYNHEYGFHMIPASLIMKDIDPLKLKDKIKALKSYYDIILLDSSPNLNQEVLATIMASDELLVVTTPDYPTLSTTLNAVKVAKQRKTPITGLILNRVRNKSFELTIHDIEYAAETPVLAVLPDHVSVLEALQYTKPVTMHNEKHDVSVEYTKLAAALIGEKHDDKRFYKRIARLFSRDMPKQDVNRELLIESMKK
ncbi:AAA family ATPase [Candidatus Woesearchaeota archaeon]|nr:AAA family ATPase [Candidatus Woesearchaeota archaeon]